MASNRSTWWAAAILVLGTSSCTAEDHPEPAVSRAEQAVTSLNGLSTVEVARNTITTNGMSLNGMSLNGMSLNGMSLNGMSLNGMSLNGYIMNGMSLNGMSLNGMSLNGMSLNGMSLNGMSLNGMSLNGMSLNGMSLNGMSLNGMSLNGLTEDALKNDPDFRKFVGYVYACAMPAEASMDLIFGEPSCPSSLPPSGGDLPEGCEYYGTLVGEKNLAPTWGGENGFCDQTCQAVIAECLADVNDPTATTVSMADALRNDPMVLETLKSIYACAMPEGATLDLELDEGVVFATLTGEHGLAPEWGEPDGSCDESCRLVIDACLRVRAGVLDVLAKDAYARTFFQYLYSCAMPPGADITLQIPGLGTPYVLQGGLGLAPEWAKGACDETCQRWVSACILARTNAFGLPVPISMRGPHPALTPSTAEEWAAFDREKIDFPLREGAYFGNLWSTTRANYSCVGPTSNVPDLTKRFCSSQGGSCMIGSVGHCAFPVSAAEACPSEFFSTTECANGAVAADFYQNYWDLGACAGFDPATGAVLDCEATNGDLFSEVLTVFLGRPEVHCGNAICQEGETPTNCPTDCRAGSWFEQFDAGLKRTRPTNERPEARIALVPGGVVIGDSVIGDVVLGGQIYSGGSRLDPQWGVLAKFDSDGVLDWAERVGGPSMIGSVAADSEGNIVVTGSYRYGLLDSIVPDPPQAEAYVRKYSPTGALLWTFWIDSDQFYMVRDPIVGQATVAPDGSVLFFVHHNAGLGRTTTFTIGGTTLSLPDEQMAVVKLDPDGNLVYAVPHDGASVWGTLTGEVIGDAAGNAFVITWQGNGPGNTLAKRDAAGELLWSVALPGEVAAAIATVNSDACVSLDSATCVQTAGCEWITDPGSGAGDCVHLDDVLLASTIKIDPGNCCYGIKLTRYSTDGAALWSRQFSGLGADAEDLVLDADGNIYLAGTTVNHINFGSTRITSSASAHWDAFLVKLTPTGDLRWYKHFPDAQVIFDTSMLVDDSGRIYLAGGLPGARVIDGMQLVDSDSELRESGDVYLASFIDRDLLGDDVTPPLITRMPDPIKAEASGPNGAQVWYEPPIAADDMDSWLVPVTCSKASGSWFAVGTTTVVCSATDLSNNTASESFVVEVVDSTPPTINHSGSIEIPTAGPGGAVVTYNVTATDAVEGGAAVTCTPPSGSLFAVGTTVVTCSVVDSGGNQSTLHFLVRVESDDTPPAVPPTVTVPDDIVEEATGPNGKVVTYTATAVDAEGAPLTPVCAPASGSTFPITTTAVLCTATDSSGNSASESFTVEVVDSPPVFAPIPDLTADPTGPDGVVVSYLPVVATDAVDGSVTATCLPPSGSLFPYGTTAVTCTAVDSAGKTAQAGFSVHVHYTWSGILEPVNADGSSIFKQKRTVPLKFRLTGASAGMTDLVATLTLAQISGDVLGTETEAVSTSAATEGNAFRYDALEDLYIFNLSTKNMDVGTWQATIDFGDGVERAVQFSLN